MSKCYFNPILIFAGKNRSLRTLAWSNTSKVASGANSLAYLSENAAYTNTLLNIHNRGGYYERSM
jgi:hypothetical protein